MAEPRKPVYQLVRRTQLLDKPKGLYLSSFRCMNSFTARAVPPPRGTVPPISTGSITAGDAESREGPRGAHTSHVRRAAATTRFGA